MFLNIQIYFIILKTYDHQFTLTTKKSLHIMFKFSPHHHSTLDNKGNLHTNRPIKICNQHRLFKLITWKDSACLVIAVITSYQDLSVDQAAKISHHLLVIVWDWMNHQGLIKSHSTVQSTHECLQAINSSSTNNQTHHQKYIPETENTKYTKTHKQEAQPSYSNSWTTVSWNLISCCTTAPKITSEHACTNWTMHTASIGSRWHFAFALCCHSNETRALIGNPPNSTQLDGTPTIPSSYIWVLTAVGERGDG